ncbi:MAG: NAD-binding protein [Armatimonadetes bacterium]|nr:NAD-binding protein [Armatimonadota bacterium]
MKDRIGFIGLGTMGKAMARNLIKAGYSVTVHSRSRGPVDELAADGAAVASSSAEAAASSDVVITMLPDSPDVELVVMGPAGVLEGARTGSVVVDMSTISPEVARSIYAAAREKGVSFLDAPVTGGETGAIGAALSIMVGGDRDAFERCLPVLKAMGKNVVYMGPSGNGQSTKLCNQVICALNILAVSEGLTLAARAGLDLESALSAVSGGSAGSWMLSNLGPKMIARDWRPGFKVSLQIKDLRLVMESAEELDLPLPGTALVRELLRSVEAHGRGSDGTQALVTAIELLAGMDKAGYSN